MAWSECLSLGWSPPSSKMALVSPYTLHTWALRQKVIHVKSHRKSKIPWVKYQRNLFTNCICCLAHSFLAAIPTANLEQTRQSYRCVQKLYTFHVYAVTFCKLKLCLWTKTICQKMSNRFICEQVHTWIEILPYLPKYLWCVLSSAPHFDEIDKIILQWGQTLICRSKTIIWSLIL